MANISKEEYDARLEKLIETAEYYSAWGIARAERIGSKPISVISELGRIFTGDK